MSKDLKAEMAMAYFKNIVELDAEENERWIRVSYLTHFLSFLSNLIIFISLLLFHTFPSLSFSPPCHTVASIDRHCLHILVAFIIKEVASSPKFCPFH